ncbi:MAG TPA: hypothetical protein PLL00_13005 [Bacteroidia bacterium]|nr:hypothetical protein [Bacteroidia bacterium]
MQNLKEISKNAKSKLTKVGLLVAANVFATVNHVMAQAEPSVENIQKTTSEAKKIAQHEELMSYVYMVIGFGVVIAIAWFTNTRVQKRRTEEAAQKAAARHHHHPHDPHRAAMQRRRPVTKVN